MHLDDGNLALWVSHTIESIPECFLSIGFKGEKPNMLSQSNLFLFPDALIS